ncbi:hypothetical protein EJD97_010093 [Solanum chilense]|uniref:Uncharacterized protein n=1 Tax=Solanum chilense TaxID=4083 RepID=A0A6N2CFH7_SOLCI|nr:hypothetical protein EJD97_010093 [Solanum chilense]
MYGSSLSLDAVEESRRCLGLEASAAVCFKSSRIVILLIDDGIKLDKKLDIKWHERLVPTVCRILQVEHVAENILEKPVRISNKNVSDYIFMHALEVAQNFNLPMQIDTR